MDNGEIQFDGFEKLIINETGVNDTTEVDFSLPQVSPSKQSQYTNVYNGNVLPQYANMPNYIYTMGNVTDAGITEKDAKHINAQYLESDIRLREYAEKKNIDFFHAQRMMQLKSVINTTTVDEAGNIIPISATNVDFNALSNAFIYQYSVVKVRSAFGENGWLLYVRDHDNNRHIAIKKRAFFDLYENFILISIKNFKYPIT